jgi:Dehydrogenases with different specificities (related to short-chain alcohol dehydrogenases)
VFAKYAVAFLIFKIDDIITRSNNPNVEVHYLDLTSLATVRQFAKDIIKTESYLEILVNNAGAGGLGSKKTVDNLQIGMQVNHFGPFLLTCLLVGKTDHEVLSVMCFFVDMTVDTGNLLLCVFQDC